MSQLILKAALLFPHRRRGGKTKSIKCPKKEHAQTNTQSSCSLILKGELKLHVKNGDVIQEQRSGTYCGRQDVAGNYLTGREG